MALLNEADAIYLGATPADRVYLGSNLVWEPAPVGGGLWTPASLSMLSAWFDADQAPFTDGQSIASYTEHSANARVFTGVAGHQPVFRTNYAGRKRFDFIGAHTPALSVASYAPTSSGLTYAISCRCVVTTYIGMLITYNGTASSYELRYNDYSLTPMLVANYAANGGASIIPSSVADTPDVDHIHMAEFVPAGTTNLWRDGTLRGSSATPAAQATTAAALNVGKRDDGAHYLGHYINEVLVIGSSINVATRQNIEGYLAHKWGTTAALPAGHPYKDTPPLAQDGPSQSLLQSYTPGTDRNDFTGEVGVRLGIGASPFTVSWIGARRHHVNQTGAHTVKLYEWFSSAVQRTAVIDYTGVAVGSYAWTAIPPITLSAGGYYALLMEVFASDGQTWCNPGAATYTGMANVYDCYLYGGLQTGTPNAVFIGLDLGW